MTTWQWQQGCKDWVDFPAKINDILNEAAASKAENVTFSVAAKGNTTCDNGGPDSDSHVAEYVVSFASMRQTSARTGFQRNIRRKPDENEAVLAYYPFSDHITCIIVAYLPFDTAYLLAEAADLEALHLWRTLFVRDFGDIANAVRRGKGYQTRLRKLKQCMDNSEYWENRYMERIRQRVAFKWRAPASSTTASTMREEEFKDRKCDLVLADRMGPYRHQVKDLGQIAMRDLSRGDWLLRDGYPLEILAIVGVAKSGKHGYGRVFYKECNPLTEHIVLQCAVLSAAVACTSARRFRCPLIGIDVTRDGLTLHAEVGELHVCAGSRAYQRMISKLPDVSVAMYLHTEEGTVEVLEFPCSSGIDAPEAFWLAVDIFVTRSK